VTGFVERLKESRFHRCTHKEKNMEHQEIATRAGVNLDDLESLLRGRATANVATRLGVSQGDVEDFIRGSATFAMTQRLGMKAMDAAKELARAKGSDGAIGIVLGEPERREFESLRARHSLTAC
jgi:hypothetical protein